MADGEEQESNFLDVCLKSNSTSNVDKILNVIPISVSSPEGESISCYAMLDPCSSFHGMADVLADRLQLPSGSPKQIFVNTLHGKKPIDIRTTKAVISGNTSSTPSFELPFNIIKSSTLSNSRVPTDKDIDPALLEEFRLRYDVTIPYVCVLIGADPRIHRCLESRTSNGLLLTKTELGVAVMGSMTSPPTEDHTSYFIGLE